MLCILYNKNKRQRKGQHTDCKICYIEEIKEKKKSKLNANLKCLENLSNTIENSINELNKLFKIINEKKEALKLDIQNIFTKIRNSLNVREDELLLEVDKKYEELFFDEEIVKLGENLPKRIKDSIKQGNLIKNEWNKNKINFLINSCLIIENDICDINKIHEKIEKCNRNKSEIKISPENKELDKFLDTIKNFGLLFIKNMNNNSQKIEEKFDKKEEGKFFEKNENIKYDEDEMKKDYYDEKNENIKYDEDEMKKDY